ncbi:DUF4365 domain-containing protein [Bacillus sp. SRB_331]|uniref:DUF4365 domain-containing protein n=1 Tax=Bacillus sp. SRB_331 TaxID=1969379 RepID=UPI000DC6069E|nr:DUF4365 domain-containing protein [Bacillus sp. SRB_331]RAN85244.1 hypothetical protein B5P42_01745 [Bacillus sp. SRB_331]
MAKLSSTKLERLAVDAINVLANKPDALLRANIPVGDKGISFDGDIEVFKDHSESVGSLIGKVPVQVKGTEVKEFTRGIRTFSIGLDHYQNYYNSKGVVFLVVEIKRNGDSKIFYKQLLPTEINEVLKKYGEEKGQKQRRIELRDLSETDLTSVCSKFLAESKKQSIILIEKSPFSREEYHSFELTSLTYNPTKTPTRNIFEHDFTVYGIRGELPVPLNQGRVAALSLEIQENVMIDGSTYELQVKVTEEFNKVILLVEGSLEISYEKGSTKFNFKIIKLHSLASQLKVLPLLLHFFSGNTITFEKLKLTFDIGTMKKRDETQRAFKSLHATFLTLKEIYQQLEINEETPFGEEGTDINRFVDQIRAFNKMIQEDDISNFKIENPKEAKFVSFNIGSIKIILFYNPSATPKLTNAFSEQIIDGRTHVVFDDATSYYTPYVLLDSSGLAFGANVKKEVIKESFNRIDPFENPELADYTNHFCLLCVTAFDLTEDVEWLELAEHLYSKYAGEYITDAIVFINQLQIKLRREGVISEEDSKQLITIKQKNAENLDMQFCTSVLLGSAVESKILFGQFESDNQERYKEFPIYKLYEHLCISIGAV